MLEGFVEAFTFKRGRLSCLFSSYFERGYCVYVCVVVLSCRRYLCSRFLSYEVLLCAWASYFTSGSAVKARPHRIWITLVSK
jgi:hypothetical protein